MSRLLIQQALLCLHDLSEHSSAPSFVQDISHRLGLSMFDCQEILRRLQGAGLVGGSELEGFSLSRPLEELDVLTVLNAAWSAAPRETAFRPLFHAAGGQVLGKTREAVQWAQALACYPSDGPLMA